MNPLGDGLMAAGMLRALGVPDERKWVIYVLPHSHVDIGYTHVQTEVEKAHWKFYEQAIEASRRTANYPAGAQFKWNVEVLWATDSYLKQATPEKQQEFVDAVKKGWIGLQALYGNELTALCRPEELVRLVDYAGRVGQRCGMPVDTAMISDVQIHQLALLLGCDLLQGGHVFRQPLVAFGIRVFLDQRGREQNHLNAGLLRCIHHLGNVLLVRRQDILVVRLSEAVPHVVNADADGHKGRLQLDHVAVKPFDQVLRLLTTDAFIDYLGNPQIRVPPGEHRVDGAKIPAAGGDGIADGHDLVARLELEFPGRVGRRGANERMALPGY